MTLPASESSNNPAPDAKKRILLVDDHDVVRRGVASLLNAEPDLEICGEADDVDSALATIARTQPHLVLLDMSLKEGDGLEVLRRMREEHPDTMALVLSMYDESVYAERALRAGAKGYVKKIDVAQTIVAAIRKVLAGEVYVSDAVASGMLVRMTGGKAPAAQVPVERLSDRELQVLRSIGRGMSNREIADQLFISTKTVESHREHIKQKLGLSSSGELLRYAIEFSRIG
jgi:DNA-binding NarL/FixJ family response regulator